MATTEDLERSLRRKVEEHVNAVLGERLAEVRRAQSALGEALARVGELRLGEEGEGTGALASVIADALRDARGRGAEEAAHSSAAAQGSGDVALLKAAVDEIDEQRSQADILHALVNRAASFAPRVAFFVVKNERATGWRARGLEGTVGDDRVRDISLPLTADNVLSEVYGTRATWSGAPGSRSGDHELMSKLGDEPPARMVAVPLVARDKCVAVLYADSAGLESDAINLEALETLVRVTGMAVELLAVKRGAPAQTAAAAPQPATEATPTAAPQAATEATAETQAQTSAETPAPTYAEAPSRVGTAATDESAPQTEATEAAAHEASTWREDSSEQAAAPQASTGEAPPGVSAPASAPPDSSAPVAESASPFTPHGGASSFGEVGQQQPAPQESQQGAGSFAAPLGESPRRRYGQDAELPVEVSDEERRYHNDARRFARLLVSEIKLYNEQKVRDGREHADLYNRLREEIDRSRQMYDKRVHPSVAPRYDYFHQELVNTLAEGDAAKLGAGYPGATVAA